MLKKVGAWCLPTEQEAVSHHLPSITAAHGGAADANAMEAFVDRVAPHIKVCGMCTGAWREMLPPATPLHAGRTYWYLANGLAKNDAHVAMLS